MNCSECGSVTGSNMECKKCEINNSDENSVICENCNAEVLSRLYELHRCFAFIEPKTILPAQFESDRHVPTLELDPESRELLEEFFEIRRKNDELKAELEEKRSALKLKVGAIFPLTQKGKAKLNVNGEMIGMVICQQTFTVDNARLKKELPDVFEHFKTEKIIPYFKETHSLI